MVWARITILLSLWAAAHAEPSPCPSAFRRLLGLFRAPELLSQPEMEAKQEAYRAFLRQVPLPGRLPAELVPDSLESKLAFLEVASGDRRLFSLEKFPSRGLASQLRKADFSAGLTEDQVRSLSALAYAGKYGDPATLAAWLTEGKGGVVEGTLQAKLEKELAEDSLDTSLQRFSLLRARRGLREKAVGALTDNRVWLDNLNFGMQLLYAHSSNALLSIPVRLPIGPDWKVLTPELAARARGEGLEAIRAEVYAKFRSRATADAYWGLLRKAYATLGWSAVAYRAYGYGMSLVDKHSQEQREENEIVDRVQAVTGHDALLHSLYASWEKKVTEQKGRPPTQAEKEEMLLYLQRLQQRAQAAG